MLSYDVVQWGKPLQPIERATPVPQSTKPKYCGVCHSDVHICDGYFDLGGGPRLRMSERGMVPPVTLGHEPYGTVVAAGPEAGGVAIGEDRLIFPWIGCGTCVRCRERCDNYCMAPNMIGLQRPGGYADHLIVPHGRYLIDRSIAGRVMRRGISKSSRKEISAARWILSAGDGRVRARSFA